MADPAEGKRLTELRVIDLKTELERRGLDKTGNKAALLERLSKAITSEGKDPETYLIVPSIGGPKMPPKKANYDASKSATTEPAMESKKQETTGPAKTNVTADVNEQKENDRKDETDDQDKEVNQDHSRKEGTKVKVIVKDTEPDSEPIKDEDNIGQDNEDDEKTLEVGVDEQVDIVVDQENNHDGDEEEANEQVSEIDVCESKDVLEGSLEDNTEECIDASIGGIIEDSIEDNEVDIEGDVIDDIDEMQDEEKEGIEEPNEKLNAEQNDKELADSGITKIVSEDNSTNDSKAEANGIDNEDSINLTIGEDEENLLAEETDSNDKSKDAGEKKKMEENIETDDKKGDSKGSGKTETTATKKEDSPSLPAPGANNAVKDAEEGEGSKSRDQSDKPPKNEEKEQKNQTANVVASRNLWVSGLSSSTRATDLKQIFSKFGKVIGAKVVTNARTPGARCYGYVTMFTSDDAEKCIQNLHRTELHGRVISVEKAKGDPQQSKKREVKPDDKGEKEKVPPTVEETEDKKKDEVDKTVEKVQENVPDREKDKKSRESSLENKDDGSLKDCDTRSTKSNGRKSDSGKRDDRNKRSWDRLRSSRSKSNDRHRRENVLSFAKIKEERERNRLKERERIAREEKRRRYEEVQKAREIERRHREEAARLEREREKLRLERERIEQEKAELLRLERERQKLEREKLEREKMELKRQQIRLEESNTRRPPPPPTIKRPPIDRRDQRETYEPERKRMAPAPPRRHSPEPVIERRTSALERVSERPGRFESSRPHKDITMHKEFKRGNDFPPRGGRSEHYHDRNIRSHNSASDPRHIKESKYDRPPTSTFTRDREVRRGDGGPKNTRDEHPRYANSKPPNTARDTRYVENSRPSGWHAGPPTKSYTVNTNNSRGDQSNWGRSDNNRWGNSNNVSGNVRHPGPHQMYHQSGPSQSVQMSNPNSTTYNRYEQYKPVQNMRKY